MRAIWSGAQPATVLLACFAWAVLSIGTHADTRTLPLATVVDGEILPPGAAQGSSGAGVPSAICYNLTVDPVTMRQASWWDGRKLYLRLEPCMGAPHLRVAVDGCPSVDPSHPVVWEFMNDHMRTQAASRSAPLPKDWEWPGDVETLNIDLSHQTYFVEVVPHSNATTNSRFKITANVYDSDVFNKDLFYPMKTAPGFNKTLMQNNVPTVTTSNSVAEDPTSTDIEILFHPVPDRAAFSGSAGNTSVVPSSSGEEVTKSGRVTTRSSTPGASPAQEAAYAARLAQVQSEISALQGQGIQPSQTVAQSFVSNRNFLGRRNQNFSTPGVYWTLPSEPWKTAITSDNVEYLIYYKEVTDILEKKFPQHRDEANDLPPKLTELKKKVSEAEMGTIFKDHREHTLWTVCGLQKPEHASPLPPDGSIESDNSQAKWVKVSDMVVLSDGRISVVLKGLKNDNNNVYLVNVVARNTQTGEHATYEMMTIQNETPVYEPPSLSQQDYGLFIGIGVTVFCIVALFVGLSIYFTKRKMRPRVRIRS